MEISDAAKLVACECAARKGLQQASDLIDDFIGFYRRTLTPLGDKAIAVQINCHAVLSAPCPCEGLRAELAIASSTVDVLKTDLAHERDTWTDEEGTVWTRPTAWAYQQACRTLRKFAELKLNPAFGAGALWAQQQYHGREIGLRGELAASRERERGLREALYRGTDHGMSGEWFCASCSFDLKKWVQSGATGTLPELCPLCKHAAAALATPEGTSLLRPAGSTPQAGCYCQPGRCRAPVVMGFQTPCRDPEKAAATPEGTRE